MTSDPAAYLGIDIGTSSIKSVLIDREQRLLASRTVEIPLSRPEEGWSEQDPEDWWRATVGSVDALAAEAPDAVARVAGIGLSGQMHGAVLLDREARVLRPAILWNDGRAEAECAKLEDAVPALREIAGNAAMPGFTAPKLLWVRKHEPEIFQRAAKVLLPKDYVRYRLASVFASDMSDAAGTLWLDVGGRAWSETLLAATGLTRTHMPDLFEGTEPTGRLSDDLARRWGMAEPPVVAGGAGDNAASALGLGAIRPGDAFLSLGTSGVLWVTTDRFMPDPSNGVHAFCHAVPGRWHQMGVILSAAASLSWAAQALGAANETELLAEVDEARLGTGSILFAPYLSGERTPHNDAAVRGAFLGLGHGVERGDLALAVVEGVAFAFRDCLEALGQAGPAIDRAMVVGGATRSDLWLTVLANVLGLPLSRVAAGEVGAAFGAARLGMIAATGEIPEQVATPAAVERVFEPDPDLSQRYARQYGRFRRLYPHLKEIAQP